MSNAREELTAVGRRLVEEKLVTGPGGNISAREGNIVHLSPSGFSLAEIGAEQWFSLDLETGEPVGENPAGLRPTCEAPVHLGCYLADQEIKAVIHIHPVTATVLASLGVEFRAPYPDFAVLLGASVPVIDYFMPGSPAFRLAVMNLVRKGHAAVLVKNHGAIIVGASLREALARALVLDEASRFIQLSLSTSGIVPYLDDKQVRELGDWEAEDYRRLLLRKERQGS